MEIGPIRPRYMDTITIIRPMEFSSGVSPRERPTVAVALKISYILSIGLAPVVSIKARVITIVTKKLTVTMADAF